ncbi:MAG: peptidylprolyl isomerase [Salinibacter sp.]|uniref:peptidylprolyl isomerase n=1 Tax=Salinibacter sp. TaxID=2065818 RepID=UPI002FC38019
MTFLRPHADALCSAVVALVFLLASTGLSGCQSPTPPSSYAARVGSHYLTEADLAEMLATMGPVRDSAEARRQAIDQWVTRMLLYREAERLNLDADEEVQRLLQRQRRSVLASAVRSRLAEKADVRPTAAEVRTYFERHKEQLRLREPYVRIQYLATADRAAARTVRRALRTPPAPPDTTWARLVAEYAVDTTRARQLSRGFVPQGRLDHQVPALADRIDGLQEGQTTPIVEASGRYHVLRLDRRIPAGTPPELDWVEAEIRRRLRIRARKQTHATEVQRLRNRAQANGALELP